MQVVGETKKKERKREKETGEEEERERNKREKSETLMWTILQPTTRVVLSRRALLEETKENETRI